MTVGAFLTTSVPATAQVGPGLRLDCGPEQGLRPLAGYVLNNDVICVVTDTDSAPVADVWITGEALNGANDRDEPGSPADYLDYSGHTGSNGEAWIDIDPLDSAPNPGQNLMCFWIDIDGDDELYRPNGLNNDGGDCTEEAIDEPENNDITDVIVMTWQDPAIDCFPESSELAAGPVSSSYQVHCLVTIGGGTLRVIAVLVTMENMGGANDPSAPSATQADYSDATDSSGVADISIEPSGSADPGTASLCGWVDLSADESFSATGAAQDGGICEAERSGDETTSATTDVIAARWLDCADQANASRPVCADTSSPPPASGGSSGGSTPEPSPTPVASATPTPTPSPSASPTPSPSSGVPSCEDPEVTCVSATESVTLSLSGGIVVIPGGDQPVLIQGDDNQIFVDGTRQVEVVGSRNNVIVVQGDGLLVIRGDLNVLTSGIGRDNARIIGNGNTVDLGAGDDVVKIVGLDNVVDLGSGPDKGRVRLGSGDRTTAESSDVSAMATRLNLIRGQAGNDLLDGSSLLEKFVGGSGNDILRGWGGNDTLMGGLGDDALYGGKGDDLLRGGRGSDLLEGGLGDDTCHAGAGNREIIRCA